MKFNQELITKARKGEIAILNDGSVEELREVIKEVWDNSYGYATWGDKYYYLTQHKDWQALKLTNMPSISVKDFFMPDTTTDPKSYLTEITKPQNPPRTYKVTRGQMKEIWEAAKTQRGKDQIMGIVSNLFDPFENEISLTEDIVRNIFNDFTDNPEFLRTYFSEYFFIPEGEAVLCRDNLGSWVIGVSDGKGKAYVTFNYNHPQSYGQIIPFTKNPPK